MREYRKNTDVLSARRTHSLSIVVGASAIYAISLLSHNQGIATVVAEFVLPLLTHYISIKAAEARFAPVSDLETKLA